MPEWSCRTAITLHEESRWKNQKKGNGVLHRYRLPTPAKVHSLLARLNLFTRIVNCAPAIQWSLWLSYQGHSPNSFSHATLCRIEVFIPRQGFHSISPNGFGEAYLIEKRQEFLILLQPFFDRHRTLTSGHNYAIGPVRVLTIAAIYLILGRTLDQTRNIIREESVEKKERFDSRRIPFLFVFTGWVNKKKKKAFSFFLTHSNDKASVHVRVRRLLWLSSRLAWCSVTGLSLVVSINIKEMFQSPPHKKSVCEQKQKVRSTRKGQGSVLGSIPKAPMWRKRLKNW